MTTSLRSEFISEFISATMRKRIKKEILRNLNDGEEASVKSLRKRVLSDDSFCDDSFTRDELKSVFKDVLEKLVMKRKIDQPEKKKVRMISEKSSNEMSHEIDSIPLIGQQDITLPINCKDITGNITLLLFYAYCDPLMTRSQQDKAIMYCTEVLTRNHVTGRLRVAKEGYNATLTGPCDGIRNFTDCLRSYDVHTFGNTDFKYVDNLPEAQKLKGLKVWPVNEIVTYGFNPIDAPLSKTGTHLKPDEFHKGVYLSCLNVLRYCSVIVTYTIFNYQHWKTQMLLSLTFEM